MLTKVQPIGQEPPSPPRPTLLIGQRVDLLLVAYTLYLVNFGELGYNYVTVSQI